MAKQMSKDCCNQHKLLAAGKTAPQGKQTMGKKPSKKNC